MQQLSLFDGSGPPTARIPGEGPTQATMFDADLTGAAGALLTAGQLPRALATELALARLNSERQAIVMADLGTGRITTVAALRKRCQALAQAQAQDGAFTWGA
jgi:hypothetical protein